MLRLKYVGQRSVANQSCNRHQFTFSIANNFICDVPQHLAKRLLSTGEYTVLPAQTISEVKPEIRKESVLVTPVIKPSKPKVKFVRKEGIQ